MTIEQHIDQVVSEDMSLHGWDLARATGQDDAIDPRDDAPPQDRLLGLLGCDPR